MIRGWVSSLLLSPVAVGLLALALASCSGIQSIEVPKEVKVQVPVACVDPAKRPKPPALAADADLLAMDDGTRTLRVWRDRKITAVYVGELEAVVEGCSRIPVNSAGGSTMQKK